MEVVLVGGSSNLGFKMSPVLNEVALFSKEQVHILGVLLDLGFLSEKHLAVLARSAFYQFQMVRYMQPFLDRKDLTTAVHALVTSTLLYHNESVWGCS